jgi:diaminohydroxyphosphoribosylaminopyrimidine deaminase/5-amino-6-(5-phosphoribosylamino)uracil reductase
MLRAAGVDVETGVLAGEARIVMSAWLAALRTRRPFITWPYQLADQGIVPLPGGAAEGRRLRLNADAVLMHDGTVGEALPGTHGAGILSLKDAAPGEDPHAVAAALYDGGVRRLLLHGGIETAGPFLAADLVDSVLAYMPDGSGSRRPRQNLPWPLLPPGFTITDVDRIDGYVRAAGRRSGLR